MNGAHIPTTVGPYEVLGLVGRGGMAEVFAVRHREHGQLCALKVVLAELSGFSERFQREVRLQARVSHANVLPVLDQCVARGRPAVLLPFIAGPTLAQLLGRHLLPPAAGIALFRQMLAGVDAIHTAGLVHRDLKPSNVLIDTSLGRPVAKIADFGVARALLDDGKLTQTGAWVGTPAYAAPEQRIDASRADARADVFTLGTLLVEMLTGKRLESDATIADLPNDLPPALRSLVSSMRSRDPASRPADAAAVLAMLDEGSDEIDDDALLERCRALTPRIGALDVQGAGNTFSPAERARPNHALPAERDLFVGRSDELSRLRELLGGSVRLLTVLGAGGTGKTRLVVHHAWIRLDDWPGGAWFCDLSDARSADGICSAVARTLDVPLGNDPLSQLGSAIAGRGRCLVILDNFEQVTRFASETLGHWLDRASEAVFVVTSRERLGLPGENTLSLDPMREDDAHVLFVRRAESGQQDFLPTAVDGEVIQNLVKLLDGLPLAVELAAARARVMTPNMMLSRMDERFKLLVSAGGRKDRQATLRATLDWSFELLTQAEQAGLSQLSVFEDGFTLATADAVLRVGDVWAADIVQGLVDKSLVRRISETRFGMLVSIQQYAAMKLTESGEGKEVEERHGRTFAAFGTREALAAVRTHGGVARWWALAADLDNLVAATRRALRRGDATVAALTARACWVVFERRDPLRTAIQLLEEVLELPGLDLVAAMDVRCDVGSAWLRAGQPAQARAHLERVLRLSDDEALDTRLLHARQRALCTMGSVCSEQRRLDLAHEHYTAALALNSHTHNRLTEALVLGSLGSLYRASGKLDDAFAHFQAALCIHRETGNRRHEGISLNNLGQLQFERGKLKEALDYNIQALHIHREVGDRGAEGSVLSNIGGIYVLWGQTANALTHYTKALALHRELGNPHNEALILRNLGNLYLSSGQLEEASARYAAALHLHRQVGDRVGEAAVLSSMGSVCRARGAYEEARSRYQAALERFREAGDRRREANTLDMCGIVLSLQGELTEALHSHEAALQIAEEMDDRRQQGLCCCNLGTLYRQMARPAESRRCLEAAMAIAREIGNLHEENRAFGEYMRLIAEQSDAVATRDPTDAMLARLHALGDINGQVWLLSVRAEVEQQAGESAQARAALAEADVLAASVSRQLQSSTLELLTRIETIVAPSS